MSTSGGRCRLIPVSHHRRYVTAMVTVVLLAGCSGTPSGSVDATSPSDTELSPTDTVETTTERRSGTATTTPTEHGDSPTKQMDKHPSLESVLLRLVRADNRTAFASTHGLEMTDKGVLVLVQVASNRGLPAGFDVTVVARHENLIRSYVPVDTLVPLAEHENVSYIRTPPESTTDN